MRSAPCAARASTPALDGLAKAARWGALKALSHSRGRKPADPRDAQIAGLRRRAERAEAELEKAQRVIEVQGIVSALLGELLEPGGAKPSTER